MAILALVAIVGTHAQMRAPILWLTPAGQIEVAGKKVNARLTPGASRIRIPGGFAFNFTGVHGGVLLDDLPDLRLTGSMTISVWVNLRSYVNDGPGAQILFRGDDRNGLDPYTLSIGPTGIISFGIQDDQARGMAVGSEIPLRQWIHVLASFDARTGAEQLWLNRTPVAWAKTTRRPLEILDPGYAPGIGIGNVQNDHGPHNQPLNGMIADLRLYDRAYDVDMVEPMGIPWKESGASIQPN